LRFGKKINTRLHFASVSVSLRPDPSPLHYAVTGRTPWQAKDTRRRYTMAQQAKEKDKREKDKRTKMK